MFMGAEVDYKPYYKPAKIVNLPFKTCVYRTKNDSGKSIVGRGKTDFINSKYYEPHKCATYNFELFRSSDTSSSSMSSTQSSSGSFNISNDSSYYSNVDASSSAVNVSNSNFNNSIVDDSPFSKNMTDTLNLGATSTPVNNDIIIDIGHDGINDFFIDGSMPTPKTNTLFSPNIEDNDSDPILIDFKKNNN